MTSSPSSPPSAAAGLASSIVVYILYTCACTHNKQTVFFSYYKSVCWSRRVELLLGNFYYLYARTVRLLCIHPSSNCWQAAHASIVVAYLVLPLFLSRSQQFIGSHNTRTTTQESMTAKGRVCMAYGESPKCVYVSFDCYVTSSVRCYYVKYNKQLSAQYSRTCCRSLYLFQLPP